MFYSFHFSSRSCGLIIQGNKKPKLDKTVGEDSLLEILGFNKFELEPVVAVNHLSQASPVTFDVCNINFSSWIIEI